MRVAGRRDRVQGPGHALFKCMFREAPVAMRLRGWETGLCEDQEPEGGSPQEGTAQSYPRHTARALSSLQLGCLMTWLTGFQT